MNNNPSTAPAQCPFRGTRIGGALGSKPQTDDWWPNRLQVELLHQNLPQANPLKDFDYSNPKSGVGKLGYDFPKRRSPKL